MSADVPDPSARERPTGPAARRPKESAARAFVARVYERASDDNVFFLASGLTFSVVLATIPFLIFLVSLPAVVLGGGGIETFQEEALQWLWRIVPVDAPEVRADLQERLRAILQSAGSIGAVSLVLFAWFSTRLFGALRTALDEVFDIEDTRGALRGKVVDLQLVVVSTILLSVNIAATAFLGIEGLDRLGIVGIAPGLFRALAAAVLPFLTVFVMFLLIYKFLPAKRLRWRTAAVAAVVAALGFELVKLGFSWYVVSYGTYQNVYYAFATIIVLVLAVYYASILFLLGGEVGQVYDIHRRMRRQREILD